MRGGAEWAEKYACVHGAQPMVMFVDVPYHSCLRVQLYPIVRAYTPMGMYLHMQNVCSMCISIFLIRLLIALQMVLVFLNASAHSM